MSNSLSTQLMPSMFPLSNLGGWQTVGETLKQRAIAYSQSTPLRAGMRGMQDLHEVWSNALHVRREVTVSQVEGDASAPYAIVPINEKSTGLFAQSVTTVKHRARQAVSAMHTVDNRLRLYSWRVNADGSVLRTGSSSSQRDDVQQVRLVHARNYVVACRTHAGELQLSRWDVSNTGAIYQAGESKLYAHRLQWLEMIALTPDQVATLGLTQTGIWQLMLWQLQGDDDIVLLDTAEIPATTANSCALAVLPAAGDTLRLAMISSETPARLTLHLWHYRAGEGLRLAASPSIAFPEAAAIMSTAVNHDRLHVIVQTVTGQVHLVVWQLSTDGQAPFCQETMLLSEEVGHCAWQKQANGFVLAYRTLRGEIGVQAWQIGADGRAALMGKGSASATLSGEVLCCEEPLDGNAPLLTGVIDQTGEVTLLTWR